MKVEKKSNRQRTDKEEIVELTYKLKQYKILLYLVSVDIGEDELIRIAKNPDYPKTAEEVKQMIDDECKCQK